MAGIVPQAVVAEWNKSLQDNLAKRSNGYAQGRALFLLWEDASEAQETDVGKLKTLLERRFKIEGHVFHMPLDNPLEALQTRMREFLGSFSVEPNLGLIFYSGSAKVVGNRPIWVPDCDVQSSVDWFTIQETLEASSSNIALILDCVYGAVSSRNREGEGISCFRNITAEPTGGLEILAASNYMTKNDASFREALLQTITTISERQDLNEVRRAMHRLLGDASDPYYYKLSRGPNITILPLERVRLDITVEKALNAGNQRAFKGWADQAPNQIKGLKFLDQEYQDGLLSGQIDVENVRDLVHENVSSWTKLAPSCVQDIRLQGSVLFSKANTKVERRDEVFQTVKTNWLMQMALTTRNGHYQNVVVFPMKWENDGFPDGSYIARELDDLIRVFQSHFECKIEPTYSIPVTRSQLYLNKRITELLENLTSSDLLIVIYNGHGSDTVNNGGQCVLTGKGNLQINWTYQQNFLDLAPCDVAQILDCCFAGTAIKGTVLGRNEILAACDRNHPTPTKDDAYIKRVTLALEHLARKADAFSLETLHDTVRRETERQNEHRTADKRLPDPAYKLIGDIDGSITLRPRTQLAADHQRFVERNRQQAQESRDFVGHMYAKLPIHDKATQNWRIEGFAELFTEEDLLTELRARA